MVFFRQFNLLEEVITVCLLYPEDTELAFGLLAK